MAGIQEAAADAAPPLSPCADAGDAPEGFDEMADHDRDEDSAFGDDLLGGSETASLSSDISRYRIENGRTYHSYGLAYRFKYTTE